MLQPEAQTLLIGAVAVHPWLQGISSYHALFKSIKEYISLSDIYIYFSNILIIRPANKYAHTGHPKNYTATLDTLVKQVKVSQDLHEKDKFLT